MVLMLCYVKNRGEIRVELINFQMENCERNNTDFAAFQLQDKSHLSISNMIFCNNVSRAPIMYIEMFCTVEMIRCTFDRNKKMRFLGSTCIEAKKKSNLMLKNCNFYNHSFESPYMKSDCLIYSYGNVSISDCIFENNMSNDSNKAIFGFHVILLSSNLHLNTYCNYLSCILGQGNCLDI